MALYDVLHDKSLRAGDIVGISALTTAVLLFSNLMIRTAALLPSHFEKLYTRARWLGILAGSFGFPILTLPAFVAISRLAKYRMMTTNNASDSDP